MKDKREIIIGTSGYSFDDWKIAFYPENVVRRLWLPYYAQRFSCVEINSSYYAIPRDGILKRMADITPDRFRFTIKVPGEITHKRDGDLTPFNQFLKRVEEIEHKTDGLVAQFPFSFKNSDRSKDYLKFVRDNFPGEIPLFVEFRHSSWDQESVLKLLDELDIGWISPDEPDIPQLMSRKVTATGDSAYLRLHSRNAKKWWADGGKLRYDYNYQQSELGEIISRINALPAPITKVFVFFNNCHGGSAVRNALHMKEMLGQNTFPQGGQIGLL